jgi:mRNA-degrading endonuclease toxin of MazEF toxin-antitoxin module
LWGGSSSRTLATERIGRRIAQASDEEVAEVIDGLTEIIG